MITSLNNLSVPQLQVFLSAAETLNFTRTAESFSLTQSAVSKMIANLESDLGFPLFTRANNRLSLTAAGRFLAEEWTPLLRSLERTLRDASRLASRADAVSIGIPDSLREETFAPYLAGFRSAAPDVRVSFHVLAASDLVPKLASGELDFIVTGEYETASLRRLGFETKRFVRLPDVVYLRNDNPLASRSSLTVRDLAEEEINMIAPSENAAYFEKIYSLFAAEGLSPRFLPFAPNFRSMMRNLISGGRGAVISNGWIEKADHPSLVRFPLAGTSAGMIAAWSAERPSPAVSLLAESFPDA